MRVGVGNRFWPPSLCSGWSVSWSLQPPDTSRASQLGCLRSRPHTWEWFSSRRNFLLSWWGLALLGPVFRRASRSPWLGRVRCFPAFHFLLPQVASLWLPLLRRGQLSGQLLRSCCWPSRVGPTSSFSPWPTMYPMSASALACMPAFPSRLGACQGQGPCLNHLGPWCQQPSGCREVHTDTELSIWKQTDLGWILPSNPGLPAFKGCVYFLVMWPRTSCVPFWALIFSSVK